MLRLPVNPDCVRCSKEIKGGLVFFSAECVEVLAEFTSKGTHCPDCATMVEVAYLEKLAEDKN